MSATVMHTWNKRLIMIFLSAGCTKSGDTRLKTFQKNRLPGGLQNFPSPNHLRHDLAGAGAIKELHVMYATLHNMGNDKSCCAIAGYLIDGGTEHREAIRVKITMWVTIETPPRVGVASAVTTEPDKAGQTQAPATAETASSPNHRNLCGRIW